jgi:hypothetical protein
MPGEVNPFLAIVPLVCYKQLLCVENGNKIIWIKFYKKAPLRAARCEKI